MLKNGNSYIISSLSHSNKSCWGNWSSQPYPPCCELILSSPSVLPLGLCPNLGLPVSSALGFPEHILGNLGPFFLLTSLSIPPYHINSNRIIAKDCRKILKKYFKRQSCTRWQEGWRKMPILNNTASVVLCRIPYSTTSFLQPFPHQTILPQTKPQVTCSNKNPFLRKEPNTQFHGVVKS